MKIVKVIRMHSIYNISKISFFAQIDSFSEALFRKKHPTNNGVEKKVFPDDYDII